MSTTNFTNISVSGSVNTSTLVADSVITNSTTLMTTDLSLSGTLKVSSITPYLGGTSVTISAPNTSLSGDLSVNGSVLGNLDVKGNELMVLAPTVNQNRITLLPNSLANLTVTDLCMVSGNTATGAISAGFADVRIRSIGGDPLAVGLGTGNCEIFCRGLTVGRSGAGSGSFLNVLSPTITATDANVSCKTLSISQTLNVTGATTITGAVGLTGDLTSGNIIIPATRTLVVGKAGPATLNTTLDISGNVLCDARIQNSGVINNTNTTDTTTVGTGAIITTGGLSVSRNAIVGTNFTCSGTSTLTGAVAMGNNATIAGTLGVTGSTTLSSATVTGNSTFTGNISATTIGTIHRFNAIDTDAYFLNGSRTTWAYGSFGTSTTLANAGFVQFWLLQSSGLSIGSGWLKLNTTTFLSPKFLEFNFNIDITSALALTSASFTLTTADNSAFTGATTRATTRFARSYGTNEDIQITLGFYIPDKLSAPAEDFIRITYNGSASLVYSSATSVPSNTWWSLKQIY